ncbi:MAG: hypothetical protein LLF97_03655 [Planctomycetaceae bacterium]|nr:hypothetical protein [Planctomycetaceae bacterium]
MHSTITHRWIQWTGRVALLTAIICGGCKSLSAPFAKSREDESLRKQVQADHFPSAKQVGL